MMDAYQNNKRYGWICPNCGKVNAPWMPSCDCRVPSTITNDWTASYATTSSEKDDVKEYINHFYNERKD